MTTSVHSVCSVAKNSLWLRLCRAVSITGNKEKLVYKSAKLSAKLYREHGAEMETYFSGNCFPEGGVIREEVLDLGMSKNSPFSSLSFYVRWVWQLARGSTATSI